jgi:hypothetical protein
MVKGTQKSLVPNMHGGKVEHRTVLETGKGARQRMTDVLTVSQIVVRMLTTS